MEGTFTPLLLREVFPESLKEILKDTHCHPRSLVHCLPPLASRTTRCSHTSTLSRCWRETRPPQRESTSAPPSPTLLLPCFVVCSTRSSGMPSRELIDTGVVFPATWDIKTHDCNTCELMGPMDLTDVASLASTESRGSPREAAPESPAFHRPEEHAVLPADMSPCTAHCNEWQQDPLLRSSSTSYSEPEGKPRRKPPRTVSWDTHVEVWQQASRSVTWSGQIEVITIPASGRVRSAVFRHREELRAR